MKNIKYDLLLLLLPCLGLFRINLIGELYALELFLLIYFLIYITYKYFILNNSVSKIILIFMMIWFMSQIMTDWIRGTEANDYLRGWAKIIFLFISYASLMMLLNNERKMLMWTIGSAIPILIRPLQLFGEDESIYVLWKFGVGSSVLLIICTPFLIKFFNQSNDNSSILVVSLIHILFGGISFLFNARSLAGISILSGLIVLIFLRKRFSLVPKNTIAIGLLLAAILANSLSYIYSIGASGGYFGAEAQDKYESQVVYGNGIIDIISGGRPEAYVSVIAITDSTIIGHGSWAKNYEYMKILLDVRKMYSEVNEGEIYSSSANEGLIPSHSYLMGAWVEAGIAGGIFWVVAILVAVFISLPAAFFVGNVVGLIFIINLIFYLWNILFSPFGANVRVDAAWFLVLCSNVYVLQEQKKRSFP